MRSSVQVRVHLYSYRSPIKTDSHSYMRIVIVKGWLVAYMKFQPALAHTVKFEAKHSHEKKKNVHLSITTILSAYYRLALLAQQHKSIDTYACFQYGLILVFIYAERCTQKLLRLYAY